MKYNQAKTFELKPRVLAWLGVWHRVLLGLETAPDADPFYERNKLLAPEMADPILQAVEEYIQGDYERFPNYHTRANNRPEGSHLKVPDFHSLSLKDKFTLLQGLDKIYQDYTLEDPAPEPEIDPQPQYYDWE